jgi:hypothetical protein
MRTRYYKITLELPMSDGGVLSVPAKGRGLLAVHEPLSSKRQSPNGPKVITHIPTGLLLGYFRTKKRAAEVLDQLLPLADWRTIHKTGFTLEQRSELTRICRAD